MDKGPRESSSSYPLPVPQNPSSTTTTGAPTTCYTALAQGMASSPFYPWSTSHYPPGATCYPSPYIISNGSPSYLSLPNIQEGGGGGPFFTHNGFSFPFPQQEMRLFQSHNTSVSEAVMRQGETGGQHASLGCSQIGGYYALPLAPYILPPATPHVSTVTPFLPTTIVKKEEEGKGPSTELVATQVDNEEAIGNTDNVSSSTGEKKSGGEEGSRKRGKAAGVKKGRKRKLLSKNKRQVRLTIHHCTHDGCTYKSDRICNLKNHLRVHTGEKPFRCGTCSYASSNLSNLRVHERRHGGGREGEEDSEEDFDDYQ